MVEQQQGLSDDMTSTGAVKVIVIGQDTAAAAILEPLSALAKTLPALHITWVTESLLQNIACPVLDSGSEHTTPLQVPAPQLPLSGPVHRVIIGSVDRVWTDATTVLADSGTPQVLKDALHHANYVSIKTTFEVLSADFVVALAGTESYSGSEHTTPPTVPACLSINDLPALTALLTARCTKLTTVPTPLPPAVAAPAKAVGSKSSAPVTAATYRPFNPYTVGCPVLKVRPKMSSDERILAESDDEDSSSDDSDEEEERDLDRCLTAVMNMHTKSGSSTAVRGGDDGLPPASNAVLPAMPVPLYAPKRRRYKRVRYVAQEDIGVVAQKLWTGTRMLRVAAPALPEEVGGVDGAPVVAPRADQQKSMEVTTRPFHVCVRWSPPQSVAARTYIDRCLGGGGGGGEGTHPHASSAHQDPSLVASGTNLVAGGVSNKTHLESTSASPLGASSDVNMSMHSFGATQADLQQTDRPGGGAALDRRCVPNWSLVMSLEYPLDNPSLVFDEADLTERQLLALRAALGIDPSTGASSSSLSCLSLTCNGKQSTSGPSTTTKDAVVPTAASDWAVGSMPRICRLLCDVFLSPTSMLQCLDLSDHHRPMHSRVGGTAFRSFGDLFVEAVSGTSPSHAAAALGRLKTLRLSNCGLSSVESLTNGATSNETAAPTRMTQRGQMLITDVEKCRKLEQFGALLRPSLQRLDLSDNVELRLDGVVAILRGLVGLETPAAGTSSSHVAVGGTGETNSEVTLMQQVEALYRRTRLVEASLTAMAQQLDSKHSHHSLTSVNSVLGAGGIQHVSSSSNIALNINKDGTKKVTSTTAWLTSEVFLGMAYALSGSSAPLQSLNVRRCGLKATIDTVISPSMWSVGGASTGTLARESSGVTAANGVASQQRSPSSLQLQFAACLSILQQGNYRKQQGSDQAVGGESTPASASIQMLFSELDMSGNDLDVDGVEMVTQALLIVPQYSTSAPLSSTLPGATPLSLNFSGNRHLSAAVVTQLVCSLYRVPTAGPIAGSAQNLTLPKSGAASPAPGATPGTSMSDLAGIPLVPSSPGLLQQRDVDWISLLQQQRYRMTLLLEDCRCVSMVDAVTLSDFMSSMITNFGSAVMIDPTGSSNDGATGLGSTAGSTAAAQHRNSRPSTFSPSKSSKAMGLSVGRGINSPVASSLGGPAMVRPPLVLFDHLRLPIGHHDLLVAQVLEEATWASADGNNGAPATVWNGMARHREYTFHVPSVAPPLAAVGVQVTVPETSNNSNDDGISTFGVIEDTLSSTTASTAPLQHTFAAIERTHLESLVQSISTVRQKVIDPAMSPPPASYLRQWKLRKDPAVTTSSGGGSTNTSMKVTLVCDDTPPSSVTPSTATSLSFGSAGASAPSSFSGVSAASNIPASATNDHPQSYERNGRIKKATNPIDIAADAMVQTWIAGAINAAMKTGALGGTAVLRGGGARKSKNVPLLPALIRVTLLDEWERWLIDTETTVNSPPPPASSSSQQVTKSSSTTPTASSMDVVGSNPPKSASSSSANVVSSRQTSTVPIIDTTTAVAETDGVVIQSWKRYLLQRLQAALNDRIAAWNETNASSSASSPAAVVVPLVEFSAPSLPVADFEDTVEPWYTEARSSNGRVGLTVMQAASEIASMSDRQVIIRGLPLMATPVAGEDGVVAAAIEMCEVDVVFPLQCLSIRGVHSATPSVPSAVGSDSTSPRCQWQLLDSPTVMAYNRLAPAEMVTRRLLSRCMHLYEDLYQAIVRQFPSQQTLLANGCDHRLEENLLHLCAMMQPSLRAAADAQNGGRGSETGGSQARTDWAAAWQQRLDTQRYDALVVLERVITALDRTRPAMLGGPVSGAARRGGVAVLSGSGASSSSRTGSPQDAPTAIPSGSTKRQTSPVNLQVNPLHPTVGPTPPQSATSPATPAGTLSTISALRKELHLRIVQGEVKVQESTSKRFNVTEAAAVPVAVPEPAAKGPRGGAAAAKAGPRGSVAPSSPMGPKQSNAGGTVSPQLLTSQQTVLGASSENALLQSQAVESGDGSMLGSRAPSPGLAGTQSRDSSPSPIEVPGSATSSDRSTVDATLKALLLQQPQETPISGAVTSYGAGLGQPVPSYPLFDVASVGKPAATAWNVAVKAL